MQKLLAAAQQERYVASSSCRGSSGFVLIRQAYVTPILGFSGWTSGLL
jgi:hypothetical protein